MPDKSEPGTTLLKLENWIAENILPLIIRLLGMTWRVEIEGEDPIEQKKEGFIYAFWHGRMLPLIYTHRFKRIEVLISNHRDGEYVARLISRLGYLTHRGSSTRGGLDVLRPIIENLKEGGIFAITPDGPTGPKFKVKEGAAFIAKASNSPVYPVGIKVKHAIHLSSWDDFLIPMPFTSVKIIIGKKMSPDSRTGEIQEQLQKKLEQLSE